MFHPSTHFACKHFFNCGCRNFNCRFAHTKEQYTGTLPWSSAIQQAISVYKRCGEQRKEQLSPYICPPQYPVTHEYVPENPPQYQQYPSVKVNQEHKIWNDTQRKKSPCRWELTVGCKHQKEKCPFAHDKQEFRGVDWERNCQKVLMEYYKFKLEDTGTTNKKGAYMGSQFSKINHNLTLETRKYATYI